MIYVKKSIATASLSALILLTGVGHGTSHAMTFDFSKPSDIERFKTFAKTDETNKYFTGSSDSKAFIPSDVPQKTVDTPKVDTPTKPSVDLPSGNEKPTNSVEKDPEPQIPKSSAYYNRPMKYVNVGGNYYYDYGQGNSLSGVFDALNYSKAIGNSGLSIVQKQNENIALIRGIDRKNNYIMQGTATAIDNHTLLTIEHVVDNQFSSKAFSTLPAQDVKIQPKRYQNSVPVTLKASSIVPMKHGEMAVIHTKEDLSKYMDIVPLASETSIKNMKNGEKIEMNHYSNMSKDKYAPSSVTNMHRYGTPYHSEGKFIMNGRNVHPANYFKMMSNSGGSGSLIKNKNGQAIGIYFGSVGTDEGYRYHTKIGFSFIGDFRKELLNNKY